METLASLRAAVVPEGEIVLESTPNGATEVFYAEWQKANETGYTRHSFPSWYDVSYQDAVKNGEMLPFTPEESELVKQYGLSRGADRLAAQAVEGTEKFSGPGVCRGFECVLPGLGRMRVRVGSD